MKILKHILQHKYLFKVLAIVIIISIILYTKYYKRKSIYYNQTEFIGTVYKQKISENKITLYIKSKEKLVINYYGKLSEKIVLGDKIHVSGILKEPSNNTIPNLFNYKEYLYQNGIFYTINAETINKISNNTNILFYIKAKVSNRINNISKANNYIKIFILGDKSLLDEEIIDSYRKTGISHLFSISGMHISLFVSILLSFLKKISYNNYYNYGIIITFLIVYSLLIESSPSVTRSICMYILFSINKILNLKIKSIDIMCIILIIILIIKPFYIYNASFQFSYIIPFSLILYQHKIKTIKSKVIKTLYISLISFLVSFPISIYHFYQVNFFSIILNIVLIPLVSIIIFPLALISFIIPKISYVLIFFTSILEKISLFVSHKNIGIISFSKPSIILIILYYILIFMFLYNKKNILIFFLMIYHKSLVFFNNSYEITTLDVGQGDSILLTLPHNSGKILIDTGGLTNYDLTSNSLIPYFKSIGINNIDYLILTHGDYDHMGEAINLVNNFKVEKVIFNCGPYNDLEQDLIKVLDKKHIKYYSCIKELNIDNNKLYFLQTKVCDNENDNSNVIYTEINGYKFMFMGDASMNTEKEILDKYNLSDIDVLKVGHHGSKTSSSREFINEVNPNYSIISVGKNNRYGHPNNEVLNNLSDSKIYRTDIDGSIMFKIKNNKLKIETCSP